MGISNALKYIAVSKYTFYTGIMQFKFFLRNFVTPPPPHTHTIEPPPTKIKFLTLLAIF